MTSDDQRHGDTARRSESKRVFDESRTAWLVGEAVRLLNAGDDEARADYRRAVELLADTGEAAATVRAILSNVRHEDVPLRWSLLYVLSDTGDTRAISLFSDIAASEVPRVDRTSCESPRDGEVLVRTMAIEALARLAADPGAIEGLFLVLQRQSEPALRAEAVKALRGHDDRVSELLGDDERWMLDLKRREFEELTVEFEVGAATDRKPTVPRLSEHHTAPSTIHKMRSE
jgi:hypothetical protein